MKVLTLYIAVGTKKYPLIITNTWTIDPDDGEIVRIYCKEANLDQDYLKSDLPNLLEDIGSMIQEEMARKKDDNINMRVKAQQKALLQQYAFEAGYRSLSEYLLARGLEKPAMA